MNKCVGKYALGIEGSANKIGIGIVDDQGNIFCNLRRTFISPPGTGFQPRETAAHHRSHIIDLISQSLKESKIQIEEIKGPGIGAALAVGVIVARTLSLLWNVPIEGVNHCVAHIEMGRLVTQCENPTVLYVSGGNTQVITFAKNRYSIVGETLDIAVGNCFDRIARLLNLSNDPAPGYQIEQLANSAFPKFIPLPYSVKGMDVSLSGVVSTVERLIFNKPEKQQKKSDSNYIPSEYTPEDICYSLQENVFSMLIEITERAMTQTHSDEVLIVGGVGCNKRLQTMMRIMLEERGGRLCAMDERYCIDNGAMIAYTGLLAFNNNQHTILENSVIQQRYRTDDAIITWRT